MSPACWSWIAGAGSLLDRKFHHIAEYLEPGDLLVVNDTRVFPARLQGHKETGGKVEPDAALLPAGYSRPQNLRR